jgi:predicted amidohydrolase
VVEETRILNRCFVFRPRQDLVVQDKINMTRFENEEWRVSGGRPQLQTFTIGESLCAVATCYDVEFPSVAALAAEQRVDLLLVPSCTDDVHGYWRVRLCAQARTIENQCYVVMSSIVGGHPEWPEIESHYGQGGIYTPSDVGMPEGGIKKLGALNTEGVITDAISKEELERIRKNGTVLNLRDSRSLSGISKD